MNGRHQSDDLSLHSSPRQMDSKLIVEVAALGYLLMVFRNHFGFVFHAMNTK